MLYINTFFSNLAHPVPVFFSCAWHGVSTRLKVIQGVSRLVDITAGGDFLGLFDQKSSYKHVSDFGQLWSYGHFLIPVHAFV